MVQFFSVPAFCPSPLRLLLCHGGSTTKQKLFSTTRGSRHVTTLSRFYSQFYGFTPGFTLPLHPVFTELLMLTLLNVF
ncbi:hypothetical protein ACRRTK_001656 [Alexandromys fortis]